MELNNNEIKKFIGSCCENSFIIVDCRNHKISRAEKKIFAVTYIPICKVDTALFIINVNNYDIGIEIFERDGSQSDSCGNGLILISYMMNLSKGTIKTRGGPVKVFDQDEYMAIQMNLKFSQIKGVGLTKDSMFITVGEPHIIFLLDDIESINLNEMGRLYRNEYPGGVNIDAIQMATENKYLIKTFERGVNDLTKSCGTGSLSSYLSLSFFHNINYHKQIEFKSEGGSHWVSRTGNMLKLKVSKKECIFKTMTIE